MARTAMNELQDQLEAIRREAYAAGYAAAMQAVRELTSKSTPGAPSAAAPSATRGRRAGQQTRTTSTTGNGRRGRRPGRPAQAASTAAQPAAQPARQRRTRGTAQPARRVGRPAGQRPQRGNNARMVEEVLQAAAPRALRPAEIRTAIQRDKGVAIAFTSIRHALGQLEGRRTIEQVGDSKTWRSREGANAG